MFKHTACSNCLRAARHGLKLSGKLQRIAEQERRNSKHIPYLRRNEIRHCSASTRSISGFNDIHSTPSQ